MRTKNADIFSLKIEGEIPTREDISNKFRLKNDLDLLIAGGVIDLRNNHIIEFLAEGYIKIVPIDTSKKFTKQKGAEAPDS